VIRSENRTADRIATASKQRTGSGKIVVHRLAGDAQGASHFGNVEVPVLSVDHRIGGVEDALDRLLVGGRR
jgi:hypothetical protein